MSTTAFNWGQFTRRFVPLLAVITALIFTVPFMWITGRVGIFRAGCKLSLRRTVP